MEVAKVIAKYMKLRVKSHQDIIKGTHIAESTYYRKIAKPETLSVREVKLIYDYLNVPLTERVI